MLIFLINLQILNQLRMVFFEVIDYSHVEAVLRLGILVIKSVVQDLKLPRSTFHYLTKLTHFKNTYYNILLS